MPDEPKLENYGVTVTIVLGEDRAPVVFIDTDEALDSERGPAIRVRVNDEPVFIGKERA